MISLQDNKQSIAKFFMTLKGGNGSESTENHCSSHFYIPSCINCTTIPAKSKRLNHPTEDSNT